MNTAAVSINLYVCLHVRRVSVSIFASISNSLNITLLSYDMFFFSFIFFYIKTIVKIPCVIIKKDNLSYINYRRDSERFLDP